MYLNGKTCSSTGSTAKRLIETIVVFEFCKNYANIFEDGWLIETIVVFEL